MTALIKLTLPASEFYPEEGVTFVNPAHITQIYRGRFDGDDTFVETTSGLTCIVKETPEEIAELIFNAEHPECKL